MSEIINSRRTIFTAAGIYSGLVISINETNDEALGYVLEDVIFRPTGDLRTQLSIPEIVLYSKHFIATTHDIEPITRDLN